MPGREKKQPEIRDNAEYNSSSGWEKKSTGGTRLELALNEMVLLMTPTRRQLHMQQNMRDRLIAIECLD